MDWRPIETAPKDGSKVLLYGEIWPEIVVGHWEPHSIAYPDGWHLHPSGEDGSFAAESELTHWMPLPAAPSE